MDFPLAGEENYESTSGSGTSTPNCGSGLRSPACPARTVAEAFLNSLEPLKNGVPKLYWMVFGPPHSKLLSDGFYMAYGGENI